MFKLAKPFKDEVLDNWGGLGWAETLNEPCHEKTYFCNTRNANNKGADQPAHPRSLISTFVVRCLDSIIHVLAKSKISRLAGLCS